MNLTVTELAQTRLTDLIGEQMQEQQQAIRVFIAQGGCGCSGPRFGMGLDQPSEEDAIVEIGALKFIADPASAPALQDASIDYIDDVMQQGFQITAPNAASEGGGCGCGGGAH
ncbi:MAG: iron-sulfur cluster assembly accessory protein [Dehalococcoidia bacterium]|nr:iron-sulfur cluster assembly accessory protein [Dehalococcoidia bacterium]